VTVLRLVRLFQRQVQRMVPQHVELQLLQRLRVRQTEDPFQQQHTEHRLRRTIRAAVVGTVQRCEHLFVHQRQRPFPG
jgi:hypothetical protein